MAELCKLMTRVESVNLPNYTYPIKLAYKYGKLYPTTSKYCPHYIIQFRHIAFSILSYCHSNAGVKPQMWFHVFCPNA